MKEAKYIFSFALVSLIVLCSILSAVSYAKSENFCIVFWGSIILIASLLICITVCICNENDSKRKIEKLKLEKLNNFFELLQRTNSFDVIETYDETDKTKTITKQNQLLANFVKDISKIIFELE